MLKRTNEWVWVDPAGEIDLFRNSFEIPDSGRSRNGNSADLYEPQRFATT
jgi:hypothetical protein